MLGLLERVRVMLPDHIRGVAHRECERRRLPPLVDQQRGEGVAEFVRRSVGEASWQYRARVKVFASAEYVKNRMPIPIEPEVVDENACIVELGSDDPHQLAGWLGLMDADFDVLDAPELAAAVRELGDRYHRAAGG